MRIEQHWFKLFLVLFLASLVYAQTVINGSRRYTGSVETGYNSGKTGYSGWYGKTSGVGGISVADAAGGTILYMLPTSAGSATNVLAVGAATTCPTLPADAPAFTCYQLSWVAH